MSSKIVATLPGKVVKLDIKVDDPVEEGEEVLLVELMKMETPIFAPCDGTVQKIFVRVGDEIEERDVLAIIKKN